MADVGHGHGRAASVPAGSLLSRWQAEKNVTARSALAAQIQALAIGQPLTDSAVPDALLREHLRQLAVPLDHSALLNNLPPDPRFGKHPLGHAVDDPARRGQALQNPMNDCLVRLALWRCTDGKWHVIMC